MDEHGDDKASGYGLDNAYHDLDKKYAVLNADSYVFSPHATLTTPTVAFANAEQGMHGMPLKFCGVYSAGKITKHRVMMTRILKGTPRSVVSLTFDGIDSSP